MITTLIDKVDTFERVRDQIAAILKTELANQQALAALSGRNPARWDARVFLERSLPWAEYAECPPHAPPIINVSFDSTTYDLSGSNAVERQKTTGIYHIDCYGYAVAKDQVSGGHEPADAASALEAQRAMRLVRNILMAGEYTYLALRGLVGRRWPQSVTMFQPQMDDRAVQQVCAARLVLQVDFNEFSPQVQGQPLELIAVRVKRLETGEVVLRASYPLSSTP